jgi:ABC-type polysaccharide/polyol phosphate transport system ATPase subunit
VISASIHGIQVRFNQSATMNGKIRLVIFFINQFCNFFDSIFSHLAFAEQSQKIKSRINIAVIISNHSQLIEKYSRIHATVNHQKIHTANHSASVIFYK